MEAGAVDLWRKVAAASAVACAAVGLAALLLGQPAVTFGLLLGCGLGCADLYVMAQDIDRVEAPELPEPAETSEGGRDTGGKDVDGTWTRDRGEERRPCVQMGDGAEGLGEWAEGDESPAHPELARARRAAQSLLVGRSMIRFLTIGAGLGVAALVPGINLLAAAAGVVTVRLALAIVGSIDAFASRA